MIVFKVVVLALVWAALSLGPLRIVLVLFLAEEFLLPGNGGFLKRILVILCCVAVPKQMKQGRPKTIVSVNKAAWRTAE